jgi:hypothetical protein
MAGLEKDVWVRPHRPGRFTLATTSRETGMRSVQPTSCTGGERFCACPRKRRRVRGSLGRERTRAWSASR